MSRKQGGNLFLLQIRIKCENVQAVGLTVKFIPVMGVFVACHYGVNARHSHCTFCFLTHKTRSYQER